MTSLTDQNGNKRIKLGLFFFSSSESVWDGDKYRLLLESSRYADQHDFSSVWIPERHFTKEGGLYPSPAVLQAALARETKRIQLRAGSVVLPLHNAIRVAEDWAVVDNLSGGRVGLSFASGWHPNDFIFFPERYNDRFEQMYRGIEVVQKLWQGQTVSVKGVDGKQVEIKTYPSPLQPKLPIWITASGNPQTFVKAGEIGVNLLTNLLNQSFEELAEKILLYRQALAAHGYDPHAGQVTVAMPTFVTGNDDLAQKEACRALTGYIKSATSLLKAVVYSRKQEVDFDSLSGEELDEYLQWVADRMLYQKRVLFGTPETCFKLIAEFGRIGVDEILFQLDFGVAVDLVLQALPYLNQVKELCASAAWVEQVAIPVSEPVSEQPASFSTSDNASRAKSRIPEPPLNNKHLDSFADIQARCLEEIAGSDFYDHLNQHGPQPGYGFQAIERIWRREGEALGRVRLPEALEGEADSYSIHPALLQACSQLLTAALPTASDSTNGSSKNGKSPYMLTGLRSLQIHARPERQTWGHAVLNSEALAAVSEGDVRLFNEDGSLVVEAQGLQLRQADHIDWAQSDEQPEAAAQHSSTNGSPSKKEAVSLIRNTILAAEPDQREQILLSYICEQVARVTELPVARVGVKEAISDLGLDSLMAIQLKNRIEDELGVVVPVTTFLRGGTVIDLAEQLLVQLTAPAPAQSAPVETGEGLIDHPLSSGQQALWFLHHMSKADAPYNTLEIAVSIRGELDDHALRRAFQALIDRHQSLRTIYTLTNGVPVQRILAHQEIFFRTVDASDWSDEQLNSRMVEESRLPFDLEKGPLLRVTLFARSHSEHALLLAMHHISIDFFSLEIIFKELQEIYSSEKTGIRPIVRPLTSQYTDYARWQAEMLAGPEGERLWTYWQGQLAGDLPVLNLPTDRPRSMAHSLEGAIHRFNLGEDLTRQLRDLARVEGVTLYTVLLAAFYMLLHRYTDQDDILINSPMVGRSRFEFESVVGYFANPVILRANLSGNPTFSTFLAQVHKAVLDALDHQDYPFPLVVEQLQPERQPNRSPLSDVVFNMDRLLTGGAISAMMGQPNSGDLVMEPLILEKRVARYDLVLLLVEGNDTISVMSHYKTDLFDSATISRMAEHYRVLLSNVAAEPFAKLDGLELLTGPEKTRLAAPVKSDRESKFKKLRTIRRKGIDLKGLNPVSMQGLRPGETFPLVITPAADHTDLLDWAINHRQVIEAKLLEHGAILFRGFNIASSQGFEQFARATSDELFGEYGDLPREEIGGKVYGSTPYPSDQAILFHNESSHMHCWPLKLWFYCATAPQLGGETPIVDCREVYRLIHPRIIERFVNKGLMYVRNYTQGLDVSWQTFFRTTDRSAVEDYCRRTEIEFEWRGENDLRTQKVCPAVVSHPKTGEILFFNQIQAHHLSCLEPTVRKSMLSLFSLEEMPRNVYYGDGSTIEDSVMDEIREVYSSRATYFPWQEGDILMLDNMLSAHGRNSYTGPRKIVVTMGDVIAARDVLPKIKDALEAVTTGD